jgi:hypothetical protein
MATAQPFAYNPSRLPISGTTQSGDFAVGTPVTGFTGFPQFWNGPDEDLGYVIAQPVPAGNQPNPLGIPAYLGFFRSDGFSDSAFLNLVNSISGQNFANSLLAYSWLSDNGYYTDFIPITPTPTPTNTVTPTVTQTPTPSITASQTVTPTVTQTPTPSITASQTMTPTPSITASQTVTPTKTSTPTPSITASQTPTPTVTTTRTPTPTITPSNTPNAQGFSYSNFSSTAGLTLLGNASVTSNILYLTTAANNQVGNVYRTSAIRYDRNFSARWSTFIGGGTGADGYCVQWTSTNNTTGTLGGGVGLIQAVGTINAITFLTYTNNSYNWYKNNVLTSANSVSSGLWRQTMYFWGDYNHTAQTFDLYWNTTNSKPVSANKTFTSFSFDTGSYYMGFGAGTGGLNDNQQILNWTLTFN